MDIELVSSLLGFIEKYGLPTVLLVGLLVLWFIPWVKQMLDKEKHSKQDSAKTRLFAESLKTDGEINCMLNEMLGRYDSEAVTLWQFHNGIASTAGVPFMKVSATHQATAPCTNSHAQNYRDLPLSLFSGANEVLFKGKPSLTHVDKCEDSTIRSVMDSLAIESSYFIPVTNSRGAPIALITMSYHERTKKSAEEVSGMDEYSNRVGILLESLARLSKSLKEV